MTKDFNLSAILPTPCLLPPEYAASLHTVFEWMRYVADLPETPTDMAQRLTRGIQDGRGVIMCAIALACEYIDKMDAEMGEESVTEVDGMASNVDESELPN